MVHTEGVLCEQMIQVLNDHQLQAQILRNGAAKNLEDETNITVQTVVKADKRRCSQLPEWYVTIAIVCWLISLLHYIENPPYLAYFKFVGIGECHILCLTRRSVV